MAELVARTPLAGRSFAAGSIAMAEGTAGPPDCGLAFVEMTGAGTFDLLGITALVRDEAGVLTTRLAALRVTIAWRRTDGESARIGVERFSADYLWRWLADKAAIEVRGKASTGSA